MAHRQDQHPCTLRVGDAVRVFSQTHDEWLEAEVVHFVGDHQVRVEFVVDGRRCGKTLHVRSGQLAAPAGPLGQPRGGAPSAGGTREREGVLQAKRRPCNADEARATIDPAAGSAEHEVRRCADLARKGDKAALGALLRAADAAGALLEEGSLQRLAEGGSDEAGRVIAELAAKGDKRAEWALDALGIGARAESEGLVGSCPWMDNAAACSAEHKVRQSANSAQQGDEAAVGALLQAVEAVHALLMGGSLQSLADEGSDDAARAIAELAWNGDHQACIAIRTSAAKGFAWALDALCLGDGRAQGEVAAPLLEDFSLERLANAGSVEAISVMRVLGAKGDLRAQTAVAKMAYVGLLWAVEVFRYWAGLQGHVEHLRTAAYLLNAMAVGGTWVSFVLEEWSRPPLASTRQGICVIRALAENGHHQARALIGIWAGRGADWAIKDLLRLADMDSFAVCKLAALRLQRCADEMTIYGALRAIKVLAQRGEKGAIRALDELAMEGGDGLALELLCDLAAQHLAPGQDSDFTNEFAFRELALVRDDPFPLQSRSDRVKALEARADELLARSKGTS